MKGRTDKRVLLISVIRSDFSKQLKLAFLLRSNSIDVEFYFDQRSHNLTDSIMESKEHGFKTYSSSGAFSNSYNSNKNNKQALRKRLRVLIFVRGLIKETLYLLRSKRNFYKLLQNNDISAVVVSVNSVGYNLPLYASLCYRKSVPIICIPFAISDTDALRKAVQSSAKSSPKHGLNKYFNIILNRWTLRVNTATYLVLPSELILAYTFMRFKVQYPLSFYGVKVNQLLLENEYMLKHATNQSIAAENVVVTGGVLDDELVKYSHSRNEEYTRLCNTLGWNVANKMICIALPPLIKEISSDERFLNLSVLIEKFMPDVVNLNSFNVLLCLHPRIDSTVISQFSFSDNVRWVKDPVEYYIPLSEVFVSTFSSTIRTAIAFNIPVINYDIINFNYALFKDLPGIAYAHNENEYEEIFNDFCIAGPLYQSKLLEMSHHNPLSGTFDGNSSKRIIHIIQATVEK